MNVYCLQLDIAWEDKQANHAKVRDLLDRVRPKPNPLILLPEMFSTGFSMNVAAVTDRVTQLDQRFLSDLAREYSSTIIAGIVIDDEHGKGRNQAIVFDPAGREILRYTKLHPFSPGKEAQHYIAGDDIALFELQSLPIAPLICYDLRFPEAFRRAMRRGAKMFAVIANWPLPREEHWVTLLKARAIENQSYVAAVNRCGKDPFLEYFGRSLIIDPKGNILADAGREETVLHAEIDPTLVDTWRRDFPILRDARSDLH